MRLKPLERSWKFEKIFLRLKGEVKENGFRIIFNAMHCCSDKKIAWGLIGFSK